MEDFVSAAEPERAPRPDDPFANRVTEARPAYFILLVDHSASMNKRLADGIRAREKVADIVNDFLFRLLRKSRREDGYRHYFDVSVLGYGVGPGTEGPRPFPAPRARRATGSIKPRRHVEEVRQKSKAPCGPHRAARERFPLGRPIWVEPTPGRGQTVMAEAFRKAVTLVESWIAIHAQSLPPVVLNISDGGWTGEDPMNAVSSAPGARTTLGPTLVFNCQLETADSAGGGQQLLFPSEVPPGCPVRTKELFMLSSILPESMRAEATSVQASTLERTREGSSTMRPPRDWSTSSKSARTPSREAQARPPASGDRPSLATGTARNRTRTRREAS